MNSNEIIRFLLLNIVLVIAALIDILSYKIPNWLTYPTMIGAVIYHSSAKGLEGFLFSVEGVGVGIGLLVTLYLMGGMGAGDVRLMGVVGGLLGPKSVFIAFLFTAVVGGIYALLLWVLHGYLEEKAKRYCAILKTFVFADQFTYTSQTEKKEKPKLCYGLAIALGPIISVALDLNT